MKQSWSQEFMQKYFLKRGEEKKLGGKMKKILRLRPHQSHTKGNFESLLTHHILRNLKKHIHFLARICFKGEKPCKAREAEGNGRQGKKTLPTKKKTANPSFSFFLEEGGKVTAFWWKTKGGRKADLPLLGAESGAECCGIFQGKSLYLARMPYPISMGC